MQLLSVTVEGFDQSEWSNPSGVRTPRWHQGAAVQKGLRERILLTDGVAEEMGEKLAVDLGVEFPWEN